MLGGSLEQTCNCRHPRIGVIADVPRGGAPLEGGGRLEGDALAAAAPGEAGGQGRLRPPRGTRHARRAGRGT